MHTTSVVMRLPPPTLTHSFNGGNMANKKTEKNKTVTSKKSPQGVKTKNTAGNNGKAAVGAAQGNSTAIIVIAIIASVALVILSIFGIYMVSGGSLGSNSAKEINYLRANLKRYIKFDDGAYENIEVDIPLLEYTDEHLERRIDLLLTQNKEEKPKYNGLGMVSVPITIGDVVKIYYRGYTVDEDGKQVAFDGSSNFSEGTPYSLEIGSSTFIPGFEHALIGVVPGDYSTFSAIYSGSVTEDMVVYVSFTAVYPDGTSSIATGKRIDLSDPDIDKELGEGFRAFLLGEGEGNSPLEIGVKTDAKTFPYGDGSAGYTDIVVNYATKCEDNPYTIDITFPADYGEQSLRGKAVKFDIYPSTVIVYDTPEFNEEFLTETLKITPSDYDGYQGETLVDRYKASLKKTLEESIEVANITLISDILWDVFKDKVEVKKLPKNSVSKYYNSYYKEVENYYASYSNYYSSLDAAAIAYLGLKEGDDWRAALNKKAEEAVLEKVIFFYIIRKEDFVPNRQEYKETYDKLYKEHLESYIEENGASLKNLTGSAYDTEYKRLESLMQKEYTESYFEQSVYFEFGTRKMVENLAIIK